MARFVRFVDGDNSVVIPIKGYENGIPVIDEGHIPDNIKFVERKTKETAIMKDINNVKKRRS